jgi:hypothetical protein
MRLFKSLLQHAVNEELDEDQHFITTFNSARDVDPANQKKESLVSSFHITVSQYYPTDLLSFPTRKPLHETEPNTQNRPLHTKLIFFH